MPNSWMLLVGTASTFLRTSCFLVLAAASKEDFTEENARVCDVHNRQSNTEHHIVSVGRCSSTCRIPDIYLEGSGSVGTAEPKSNVTLQCPEECPILAPCSQPRNLRCIVGSEKMAFYLKVTREVPWSAVMQQNETCTHFDPSSLVDVFEKKCKPCNVAMCGVCDAKDQDVCLECHSTPLGGFWLSSDSLQCEDSLTYVWTALLVVLGFWGIVRVFWLFSLPMRRTVNSHFRTGLRAKWLMSPLQRGELCSKFKLWEWHWKDRQGVGVMLFFNFLVFVICISFTCCYIHWYFHSGFPQLHEEFKWGLRCPLSDEPPEITTNETYYAEVFTKPMMMMSLSTYGAALTLSFVFAIFNSCCLRIFRVRHLKKNSDGYVLQVEGLPPDLTDVRHIEQWYEDICNQLSDDLQCPGEDLVVGASVVFRTQKDEQIAFDEVVNALSYRRDMFMAEDEAPELEYLKNTADPPRHRRSGWSTWLDRTYGFKGRPNLYVKDDKRDPIYGISKALGNLDSAGHGFVVFKYRHVAEAVDRYVQKHHKQKRTPRLSWLMRQLTGRVYDAEKAENMEKKLDLGFLTEQKSKHLTQSMLKMPLIKEVNILSFDLTPSEASGFIQTIPFTKPVTVLPEDICWEHYGFTLEQVRDRLNELPTGIFTTVIRTLLIYLPSAIFLAKSSFLTSGAKSAIWQLQTVAMGMMAQFGTFMLRLTVVQKATKYGAVTRERQDQVIYILIVVTDSVMTFVKFSFAVWLTRKAWEMHMMVDQKHRPTEMYAWASILWRLIWPGGIFLGYALEFLNSIIIPQLVNMQVCRCDQYTAHKTDVSLRFSAIRSKLVKMYADLIVKTSLVFLLFFEATEYAWQACWRWALVLCFRYVYLAIIWTRFATESSVNTSRLWNIAMRLWSIPLGFLACTASYHSARYWFGLRLPPLGLSNGPTTWDDESARMQMLSAVFAGTLFGTVFWLLLLRVALGLTSCLTRTLCWRCCSDKRLIQDTKASMKYPYSADHRPANFFNTNIPLVLIAQLVCRGDPEGQVTRLPKAVRERGRVVLKQVQAKLTKATMKREQDYVVHANDSVRAKQPQGVPYFSRPGSELKGKVAPWGSTVAGVVSAHEGWLEVQEGFLPFYCLGEGVLVKESKVLEEEIAMLAAFDEKEMVASSASMGMHPPTHSVTGLSDDLRKQLSDKDKQKLREQMEDLLDKRISENATKVLHPFLLGKEYQQLNTSDITKSAITETSGTNFQQDYGIRAPWKQHGGMLETIAYSPALCEFAIHFLCGVVLLAVLAVAGLVIFQSLRVLHVFDHLLSG